MEYSTDDGIWWETFYSEGEGLGETFESEVDREDVEEVVEWDGGGGGEDAAKFADGSVLGNLKGSDEGLLGCASVPERGPICEDGYDD